MPNFTTPEEILVDMASDLVTSTEGKDNVPANYISDDERMTTFIEFQVANWVDNIYVPICSGQLTL